MATDVRSSAARGGAPRSRGRTARRVGRIAGWGVAGIVSVAVVAIAVTAVLDANDRRRVPPPGELVELADGRLLHLHVAPGPDGSASGTVQRPTVILEAGSGGSAAMMTWLHRQLAEHTTVVAYDRPGYGFSDSSAGPVEAASVAADLHEALASLGVDGPFVLVGHSLGGAYVRVFASAYPDEVAGLVLLDPVHEEQGERLPAESIAELEQAQAQLAVAPALARLGVFRLTNPQGDILASLPEDAREQHRARSVTAGYMRTYAREVAGLPDLLDEVARVDGATVGAAESRGPFAGAPVRVISASEPAAGEAPAGRAAMAAMHRELADRAPTASHHVVQGSDHLSLVVDEGHAREVTSLVAEFLDELDGSG